MSGSMGLAYERSCDFYKDFHTHSRLMFVFPRGSTQMVIRTGNPEAEYTVDRESVLIVPKYVVHDDEGKSTIYDTLALFPDMKLLSAATEVMSISVSELNVFIQTFCKVRRTPWLVQLVEEYFFRRLVARASQKNALQFLELEIVSEVIRSVLQVKRPQNLDAPLSQEGVSERAIRYIETHLFEQIDLEQIAKKSAASVSTLIRAFKKHVHQTPFEYIRNRRLDEAMNLLKKGNYSVGQVAALVGYTNFGSFTDAFKQKFGNVPSDLMIGNPSPRS